MEALAQAQKYLAAARKVVVLTGAGVSAESGVPTFRGGGNTAVWRGMPAITLSSVGLLEADLNLVWEWFDHRRTLIAACAPNPAHIALAQAEAHYDEFLLATQNVDGLHRKAGSRRLIELHGNLWRGRSFATGESHELLETPLREIPPRGPSGDPLRPDVVLFGERLPPGAFEEAHFAASQCDVFLVVGTSAVVYPAASLPHAAHAAGAAVIEVNPEETELTSSVTVFVPGKAGEIVPALFSFA
jgi:NAD-dependent deacetylase